MPPGGVASAAAAATRAVVDNKGSGSGSDDAIDVERQQQQLVPLTSRIFQRGNSSALSSSPPPADDEPSSASLIINNNNNNNENTNSSSNSNRRQAQVLTVAQFAVRELRGGGGGGGGGGGVLWTLLPEYGICQLLLSYGAHWPVQWQQQRCADFLSDRPPPFQELSVSAMVSGAGGEQQQQPPLLVLDPALNHPSEHSQISTEFLVLTAIQIPIFVVWVTAICLADTRDSDRIDVFRLFQFPVARLAHFLASLSAIFATIAASEMVTQTLKAIVARRRPNFYALCGFDAATKMCTGTPFWRCEAQHSFPSGHSSLTVCAATFLSLFWVSHILRRPRWSINGKRLAIVCTITPLYGWALHVAATRLVDKFHHYDDVLAGCLLGVLVPTVTFHLFFPPLWHPQVGIPWSVVNLQQQQQQRKESAAA